MAAGEVVKQHPGEKDEGQFKASSTQQRVQRGTKRPWWQHFQVNRDRSPAKRLRRRLTQHTETRTGPDKEELIQNWLEETSWSGEASTEYQTEQSEAEAKMPGQAAAIDPSPTVSVEESTTSTSRKSTRFAASVHDTNYHQALLDRNIVIEREKPPPELMRKAHRIVSRARNSPEIDDVTIQRLIDESRGLRNAKKAVIDQQLASHIIPAMNKIPDQRLQMTAGQQWVDSVPVPLNANVAKVLATQYPLPKPNTPLPLPKPKPDLAFGYSKAAFTHKQLTAIELLEDRFGQSYIVPDQTIRFPFLVTEFISQAQNETHYIATNKVAGAGAIALDGNWELMRCSLQNFDYEEPQFFSVTMDHDTACINIHWLRAPIEGEEQQTFYVERLSQYLLREENGIRAFS
ncbi:hypothetical protein A1O3_06159 [Capronia epimyces CBS 606.96]|uniref:DUF7924 domain-containing protein n=1 Tax=Capronia epimyces CBS 606.96 TaxID=1182542 RepID=W9XZH8_9EURO|nr:uncharacterized protein A1O3_06159 [Capronia epimyces CBS 606.96]EXJ82346.1 hypothetical protein A1O3_06159 [Capronia epimyces CBS 606.96]